MKKIILALLVFILLLVFAYALKINKAGFSDDEWITLFVVENKDPSNMVYHYSFDRPLRGYFEKYWITLLGTRMLNYQLAGLAIRLGDTLIFFTILMLLFPKKYSLNLAASALALIYPGFLQQYHAFDYQAQFVSRFAMMASFLICLLPIVFRKRWLVFVAVPVSMGMIVVSAGIMELYIGMDLFRYFLIFVAYQKFPPTSGRPGRQALLYSLPYFFTTVAFTVWRLLIFESRRATVDAGEMASALTTFPGLLGLAGSFFQNLYRQVISAWYQPLAIHLPYLEGSLVLSIIMMALVAAVVIALLLLAARSDGEMEESDPLDRRYAVYMLIGGLIMAAGSLVPVVFGGRDIGFNTSYNRFSFPGLTGSVMLFVGALSLVKQRTLRFSALYLFVGIALLTQLANGARYEANGEVTRSTWWQMAWRVPDLLPETTLTGLIEHGSLSESYTLWGPASLIYYPDDRSIIVSAEVLNEETRPWIEDQIVSEEIKRGNEFINDFSKLLILSRRAESCLHLVDGQHPEISENDPQLIRDLAAFSHLDRVDPASMKELNLDPNLFGREPDRGWCYFYQKAQLARQQRDWAAVSSLGEVALSQGLAANDPMEWLVFLQAFAYTDSASYAETLEIVRSDPYAGSQACPVVESYSQELSATAWEDAHQKLLADVCD